MDKYESFGTSSYSVGNCGDRSMELRDLYALSAENSAKYADNEAGKQQEFRLVETTSCHSEAEVQVIVNGPPIDLLSAQCTTEESTKTMSTYTHRITTPETTSAGCSVSSSFFGNEMLEH
jgi:hypothetical protein